MLSGCRLWVRRVGEEVSLAVEALVALDSLQVDVISDNVSDTYVSKTPFARSEIDNVINGGARIISGHSLLVANLGYGLLLRTRLAAAEHAFLFDTGTEPAAFLRNCDSLDLDLGAVEEIAITHGHWDHMGALTAAVDAIVAQRGSVTVHVNSQMFNERAVRLSRGAVIPVEMVPTPDELRSHGATVVNDDEARLLGDGHAYYSGEIPRVTAFEKGRDDHVCRPAGGSADWQPDPLLLDERMLVVHVRDLGLIVFSACSHAGIVNVCTEVRRLFPDIPIHAVMGGLHLGGVMERIIPETVDGLEPFDIRYIICGHCTGWRALHALADAYGDRVSQSAVGTSYHFTATLS
ncbi:MBL fold metallo-hydrolase [Mycobacterium montefiorense]|uniref:MBL fold metallo-hydrolase n=1 Tax=Mycobacterium montefiorense TaxID=154654 RepID=A0AA37V0C6_9MYCO|nr:MBL fold metallo-hydrolase [Mycobacterium montefiorense]GKU36905.1 MBL fold metallo-hydrolase [Mycobacterium montefiorense]GKU43189.1 MBL fold metallo-hydrolase [Mycobacterium montefiorense]GKU48500.1 MBL fold metallo-hydrolase [Mycobacterium montefiorense]GKU50530.1 MBL fold metallo-hydrolase [Mycobacterium montefiorense]